jgi:hypothetical protein
MAQTPPHPRPSDQLVVPLPGAPLSLEQVVEHTFKLPDGKSKTDVRKSKVYRDAAGRMRIERSATGPSGEPVPLIQIYDSVAGFAVFLTPDFVAHRIVGIPKVEPQPGGRLAFFGSPVPMAGNRRTETLERRMIEGIDCEGWRATGTSDDQPPRTTVDERWLSHELGVVTVMEATGLNDERYSARARNVIRGDPDPELFVIPKEYTIKEEGDFSKE